jgi:F-type H+-transporting ATPase subunit delta
MNHGKISIRYAKALLGSATESKVEDKVYNDMCTLEQSFKQFATLQQVLTNPSITASEKANVLKLACGKNIHATTQAFIDFVIKQGRVSQMQWMALMYQELYRKKQNTVVTTLTSAIELPAALQKKIASWIEKNQGHKVELRTEINPDIIGGYIIDIENNRLDASISGQLSKLNKYAGH